MLSRRKEVTIKVFYTWGTHVLNNKFDPGFNTEIKWDVPLLDGYEYCFVQNIASKPGSHHFTGIDNPSLITEINGWGAQAVLVYGWAFKSHLQSLRYYHKRIPVFFRGDSTLIDQRDGLLGMLRIFILRFIYKHVDTAIYVGSNNKDYFLKCGIPAENLVLGPHAIENERFHRNESNLKWAREFKAKFGIPVEGFVFLFAGKLEEKKDPELLLKAFCQIDRPDIFLIIVGNGVLEKPLKQKYSNEKGVHFVDFQNQQLMPAVYQLADIFLLPSKGPNETWGLAINEAMAAGKPILASDRCGATADLVHIRKNGLIFKHGNIYDLKKKMEFVLDHQDLLQQWGETSLKIIKEYSLEKVALVIESLVHRTKPNSKE
jgi:glycosyltransferase involved in cell wall biosynthesis